MCLVLRSSEFVIIVGVLIIAGESFLLTLPTTARWQGRPALDKEEACDPRREEEVDADGVVELASDLLEVEDDLEEVDEGDERHERGGDPPEQRQGSRAGTPSTAQTYCSVFHSMARRTSLTR
jgi:hypothetical protein